MVYSSQQIFLNEFSKNNKTYLNPQKNSFFKFFTENNIRNNFYLQL